MQKDWSLIHNILHLISDLVLYSVIEENGAKRVAEVSRELEQIKEHNTSLLAQLTTLKVCVIYIIYIYIYIYIIYTVHVKKRIILMHVICMHTYIT